MAIKITDDCISCDACISECPNNAIYEPDQEWSYAEGTELDGDITFTVCNSGVSSLCHWRFTTK